MAAAVLKLQDYPKDNRSRMVIPLREQVSAYMIEKMGWPKSFCDYYAEKFWYHYQAQVVSVSNKIIDNSVNRIISQIANCKTVEELTKVYNDNKQLVHDAGIIDKFATRKSEINR